MWTSGYKISKHIWHRSSITKRSNTNHPKKKKKYNICGYWLLVNVLTDFIKFCQILSELWGLQIWRSRVFCWKTLKFQNTLIPKSFNLSRSNPNFFTSQCQWNVHPQISFGNHNYVLRDLDSRFGLTSLILLKNIINSSHINTTCVWELITYELYINKGKMIWFWEM